MSRRLLACQQAWSLTEQMLEAARHGLWEDLPELQSERQAVLRVLEAPATPLDATVQTKFLQQMLDAAPELLALVQAQRDELSRLLRDFQMGRAMAREYGNS